MVATRLSIRHRGFQNMTMLTRILHSTPSMPQLTRLPTIEVVHKALKVKRRSLYLRKARNLAARKTILKVTLGRQLAVPTKQSLRQLASGESAIAGLPVVSQTLP